MTFTRFSAANYILLESDLHFFKINVYIELKKSYTRSNRITRKNQHDVISCEKIRKKIEQCFFILGLVFENIQFENLSTILARG